jgi:DNA-directed RNA polymerase subunit H
MWRYQVVEGSNPPEPVGCSLELSAAPSSGGGGLKFAVKDHELVPEHVLLTPSEAEEVLKEYKAEAPQLPKISVNDPAAKEIGAKVGDIIKVIRKSHTARQSVFYRLVID